MKIDELSSNAELMKEIGTRIHDRRISLSLTQAQLAQRSGVSVRTIANLENGADVTTSSLFSVLRSLSILSNVDLLVPEHQIRPSELLDSKPKRQRVRGAKISDTHKWKWGDEK